MVLRCVLGTQYTTVSLHTPRRRDHLLSYWSHFSFAHWDWFEASEEERQCLLREHFCKEHCKGKEDIILHCLKPLPRGLQKLSATNWVELLGLFFFSVKLSSVLML